MMPRFSVWTDRKLVAVSEGRLLDSTRCLVPRGSVLKVEMD